MNPDDFQDIWSHVDEALGEALIGRDLLLDRALAASDEAGLPTIAVSPNLGKFLFLLAQISGARRVLEVGTLGGYSTIWLARALPADGYLLSLELLETHAAVARENVRAAGLDELVEIQVGPAAETMKQRAAAGEQPFDFVFLDADKEGYPEYLRAALALARPGTVIVADNIVRGGAVFDPDQRSPVLEGVRTFLADVAADPRLSAVGLQLVGSKGYDGFAVVRVEETG